MAEPSLLGALRDPQFRSDTLRNLVDALNGAKRSLTVGSLGAAGDMGSTLANLVRAGAGTAYHEATGRPIPQALEYRDPARDFGTSASLGNFAESQGWLPPQTFSLPEQAGALLGPIVAMKAPDLANSTLRGLVSALKSEPSRNAVEGFMNGMGMKPQAIVYHGSPHQFDAFDSSKIGTGEGAQAYGHGLYLAEAPDVAKSYQDTLSKFFTTSYAVPGGKELLPGAPKWAAADIADLMKVHGVDPTTREGAEWLKSEISARYMGGDHVTKSDVMKFLQSEVEKRSNRGALYKVDLPDPLIARMLDWDKPLSQQAPEVNKALKNFADLQGFENYIPKGETAPVLVGRGISGDSRGQDLYKFFGRDASSNDAASTLRGLGVPGIRYLDGGSRADGAGTSNFVLFPGEESALTILERNGKPVRR